MRQLGARLPDLGPVETDVELPSATPQREPSPVEANHVEQPQPPAEARPAEELRKSAPAGARPERVPEERRVPEAQRVPVEPVATQSEPAAGGRWEEFHEPQPLAPGRSGRISFDPMAETMAPVHGPSWGRYSGGLLNADSERERRSSFLTLAVPGIAAILAVGALLWSGSLRDRVRQQDAAMNALQEQNQKLADTLAEMNGDQKAAGALNPDAKSTGAPGAGASQSNANQASPAPHQQPSTQPAASGPSEQAASAASGGSEAAASRQLEKRQGVATPPPVQSGQRKEAHSRKPVEVGYAPEIVPPYPTTFRQQNVTVNAANSQPVPNAPAYHASVSVAAAPSAGKISAPTTARGTSSAGASSAGTSTVAPAGSTARGSIAVSSNAVRQPSYTSTPGMSGSASPAPAAYRGAANSTNTTSYSPSGSGASVNPLAENVQAVEALQRHSTVPLKEFHLRAGIRTQVSPAVGVSVERPDQVHGSYALMINQGGSSYQLRGEVNRPLVFVDNATHEEYALVVLRIADQQVYGYMRSAR